MLTMQHQKLTLTNCHTEEKDRRENEKDIQEDEDRCIGRKRDSRKVRSKSKKLEFSFVHTVIKKIAYGFYSIL